MGHNIEQGAGGLSFVEIQRFCGICPKTFETDCIFALKKIEEHFQFSDIRYGRILRNHYIIPLLYLSFENFVKCCSMFKYDVMYGQTFHCFYTLLRNI